MGCLTVIAALVLVVLSGVPATMDGTSGVAAPTPAPSEVVVERDANGAWSVVVTMDGDELCSEFRSGGGGSSGCGPVSALSRDAIVLATGGGRPFVAHGIVRGDVDRVRLELVTGDSIDVTVVSLEPLGLTARAFAARVPRPEDIVWYVALDDDGRELGRAPGQAAPRPSLPPPRTAEPLVLPAPSAERVCAEYRLTPGDHGADTTELVQGARAILLRRLTALRTPEPRVDVQGDVDLAVSSLGGEDLIRMLIAPGQVTFVPVPLEMDHRVEEGQPLPAAMADTEPLFTGEGIATARAVVDESGLPAVDLVLSAEAARIFDDHADDHFGERIAIVIDGSVWSAPALNAPDFDGEARISGGTPEDVVVIAALMGSGPLPAPLEELRFGACDAPA
jgi:hypothetical protein